MDIPGLSTLYAIHKRGIDRKNDVLQQRKELAKELLENCQTWSKVLLETFAAAVERWKVDGREAAEQEILAQEQDFMKLEYWGLEHESPIMKFLAEDRRFVAFVNSCADFYHSALSVKRLAWGQIEDHPGHFVSSHDVGLDVMVAAWHAEIERMLRNVSTNHMALKVLTPI